MNPEKKTKEYSEMGTPQRGTVFSILLNIYLHKFDSIMESMCGKYYKSTLKKNPEYTKTHNKISNLRSYFFPTHRSKRTKNISEKERLKSICKLDKKKRIFKSVIFDNSENYKIYYVRYADDFLIGTTGGKGKAQ